MERSFITKVSHRIEMVFTVATLRMKSVVAFSSGTLYFWCV